MRIPPSLFLSLVLFGPHLLGSAWARESDLLGLVNRWRVLASPADVPMADWCSGSSAGLVVRSGALTLDCWCGLALWRWTAGAPLVVMVVRSRPAETPDPF